MNKYIESGKVVATGLNFLGIVAISDPIRTDVPAAVTECMKAGIKVKIVTGDTTGTAIESVDRLDFGQILTAISIL